MKQLLKYTVEYWFLRMEPIESYEHYVQEVIAATPEDAINTMKKLAPLGAKDFKIVNYDR